MNELVGRPVPFLRWSVLTMMLRGRHLLREWQVGDGRETALEKYVVARARPGDVDDAIRVIDHFCRHVSFLINVGDEKGKILDKAVERTQPRLVLELGSAGTGAGSRPSAQRSHPALVIGLSRPSDRRPARRIQARSGAVQQKAIVSADELTSPGAPGTRGCDGHETTFA